MFYKSTIIFKFYHYNNFIKDISSTIGIKEIEIWQAL